VHVVINVPASAGSVSNVWLDLFPIFPRRRLLDLVVAKGKLSSNVAAATVAIPIAIRVNTDFSLLAFRKRL